MVVDILVDPDGFFRKEVEDVSFLQPVSVVILAAVATTLIPLVVLYHIQVILEDSIGSYVIVFGMVSILGGMLAIVGMWLLTATILYGAASYLGGEGGYRTTLLIAGWGFLPFVLSGVVNAIFVYQIVSEIFATTGVDSVTVTTMMNVLESHPLMRVAQLISLLSMIWTTSIWAFAVRHLHALSLKQSFIAAAVPAVALVLYWLVMLL